jgi:hypothetical protein
MLWDVTRAILATAIVAIAALGAGHWIGRILPASFSRLDRLACCWLGGLGLLGIVLFLVGQIVFAPATILLVISIAVLSAVRPIMREIAAGTGRKVEVSVFPALTVAFVLILTGLGGLADIVGDVGNDAIAYHLLGPKVWLRNEIIRPVLDSCHTAFPATAEVVFGSAMLLGGPHGPGLMAVLTLSMMLLISGSIGIRSGLSHRGAWWVAAFIASMPAVYAGAHSGFVDVLYAGFILAAARVGFDARRLCDFVALGFFCGLAIATKYTGLLALPALVVSVCSYGAASFGIGRGPRIGSLGVTAVTACLISAPFYLRNWILLGSPIYPPPPLLSSIFRVKYLSQGAVHSFHAYILQRGAGLGRGLRAYLLLPFNLTYHTSNFHGGGGIGLYALALGPIGLMLSRTNRFAKGLALLAWLLTTLWFVTQQESRFLIHVYVIGAVFAALAWQHVRSRGPRYSSRLAEVAIAISLTYGLFMITRTRAEDIRSVFSASFAEQRRQERIPYLDSFRYLNSNPAVKKVLILDRSVPTYYIDKGYIKPFGRWGEQTVPDVTNIQEALGRLSDLRISHVLDVNSEISGFQVHRNTPGLILVFERPQQRVYGVNP